jgi:hypothetical protein
MSSRFAEHAAQADRHIDGLFGEPVRMVPRSEVPKRKPVVDTARAVREIVGRFTRTPYEAALTGGARGDAVVATTEAQLQLGRDQVALLGWEPREHDAAVLIGRTPAEQFEVSKAIKDHLGRWTLHLVQDEQ